MRLKIGFWEEGFVSTWNSGFFFSAFKALNFMDIQFLQSPHHTETDVIPISLYVKEWRMLTLLCSLNATRIYSKSWLVEENDLFHYWLNTQGETSATKKQCVISFKKIISEWWKKDRFSHEDSQGKIQLSREEKDLFS